MNGIDIIYGDDPREMVRELLGTANVETKISAGMTIVIKPNLVVAKTASEGATTHPEIVEGIVAFLKDHGVRDIVVAEGAWVGEGTQRAFERCGYTALAKRHGLKLVDTKKDKIVRKSIRNLSLDICEIIDRADFLINVPVLKGHCQTVLTCCLKNLKGCIPDGEKRRYHTLGLHGPIAALNTVIRPDLHVVDGICGDLSFEEGGTPVVSNRILLGTDPVMLDSYGAMLMGHEPNEIDYIGLSARYGVGRLFDETVSVREFRKELCPKTRLSADGKVRQLSKFIDENGACSACYAALICALNKTGVRNLPYKIKIGQGFRGQKLSGFGVGNCCADCARHVSGCPPKASNIVRIIEESR